MHDIDSNTPAAKADFLDPNLITITHDRGEAMYVTLVRMDATRAKIELAFYHRCSIRQHVKN